MDGFLLESGGDRLLLEDGSGVYGIDDLISIVGGAPVTGSSGAGTAADPTVTLPAGIQNGDLGVLLVSSSAGVGSMSDPAGWTLLSPSPLVSTTVLAVRVWTKTLTAAESSTAVTATAAAAKWNAAALVLHSVGGASVDVTASSVGAASTSLTVPAVTPTMGDELLIQLSGIRYSAATVPSHTAAAGWTELSETVGGVSPVNAAVVATQQLTSGAGVAQGPATATIANGQNGTFTLAIASSPVSAPGTYVADGALVIGDSLFDRVQSDDSPNSYGGPYGTDAVKDALVAAGWDSAKVRTSGKASRKIADSAVGLPITQNVIRSWRTTESFDPKTYVIALGTNNRDTTQAEMKAEIDKVLDVIEDETPNPGQPYTVYWVGTAYPLSNTGDQASVDLLWAALAQAQTERAGGPITLIPLDWESYVRAHNETGLWDPDGVHMIDPAGYALRNDYIARSSRGNEPNYGTAGGGYTWAGTATGKRVTGGSATGGYQWAGTASGKRVAGGSSSSSYTWAGTASGKRVAGGSATGGTYTWAGTASGKRIPKASSSGTYTWSGTASGKRVAGGSATGGYTWAGTASGKRVAGGSVSAGYTWAGSATGQRPGIAVPQGSASGGYTFSGSATGSRRSTGSATGGYQWAGSATGARAARGTASGGYTWAGSASGARKPVGGATGSYSWSGAAQGARRPVGTASGSFTWAGSAAGLAPVVGGKAGTAAGTYTWSGSATGSRPARGSASGGYSWAGSASGEMPAVGVNEGSAGGTFTFTGSAAGVRPARGAATGTVTWTGTAAGARVMRGTASGTVTWTGTAYGAADVTDINATAQVIRDRSAEMVATGRSAATVEHERAEAVL